MRKVTKLECEVDNLMPGYWDDSTEEFIPIDQTNVKEVSDILHCSPELLDVLVGFAESLKDLLRYDFADFDKRLTALER